MKPLECFEQVNSVIIFIVVNDQYDLWVKTV